MNRTSWKFILIFFMTLDHIAMAFLSPTSFLYQLMRFFGRCVAISFCYLLVESFQKTSSKKRFVERLLLFALISYLPYVYFETPFSYFNFDMMFTLLICFLMLMLLEKFKEENMGENLSLLVVLGACILCIRCDWLFFAPLWCASFYMYKKKRQSKMVLLICITSILFTWWKVYEDTGSIMNCIEQYWFCSGVFLFYIFQRVYNHQRGDKPLKYLFYIYYPLHLAVIDLITMIKK